MRGHRYRLDLRTFLRGTLTVLGGQQVNYDNVKLTVEAPSGGDGEDDGRGTSTGLRGQGQVLPGAGGLGACTTDDRRVPQPAKGQGNPGGVSLSARQLLINQRISQAAVRRVNATTDRITRGLTGDDIRDCALTWDDFNAAFTASLVGPDPVGPATAGGAPRKVPTRTRQASDPASVKLERTQLVISQRIAQAAVRRINHLQAELKSGITGRQIVNGSLVRANLTPAVQTNTR